MSRNITEVLQKKLSVINYQQSKLKTLEDEINDLKKKFINTEPVRLFYSYGTSWELYPQPETFPPAGGAQLGCANERIDPTTTSTNFKKLINELYIYYGPHVPSLTIPSMGTPIQWLQTGSYLGASGTPVKVKGSVFNLKGYNEGEAKSFEDLKKKYSWPGSEDSEDSEDSELRLIYTVFCGETPVVNFIAVAIVNILDHTFIRARKMIVSRTELSGYSPGIFLLAQNSLSTIKDIKVKPHANRNIKLFDGNGSEYKIITSPMTTTSELKLNIEGVDLSPVF